MSECRYVIERLVSLKEYIPVLPEWHETSWPPETSLTWLKQKYGHEYRLVCHDR